MIMKLTMMLMLRYPTWSRTIMLTSFLVQLILSWIVLGGAMAVLLVWWNS